MAGFSVRSRVDSKGALLPSAADGFVAGTKILLAHGGTAPVEQLTNQHVARKPDGAVARILSVTSGAADQLVYSIRTESGSSMSATRWHPIVCRGSVKPACEVALGDQVLLGWNELTAVVAVRRERYDGPVFAIEIEGDATPASHYVVANGIVTGDTTLQWGLEEERGVRKRVVVGFDSDGKPVYRRPSRPRRP